MSNMICKCGYNFQIAFEVYAKNLLSDLQVGQQKVLPAFSCPNCGKALTKNVIAEKKENGELSFEEFTGQLPENPEYPGEKPEEVSSALSVIRAMNPGINIPSGAQLAREIAALEAAEKSGQ